MKDEKKLDFVLNKAASLSKAQRRYASGAIGFLVLGILAGDIPALSVLGQFVPFGIGISLMAWFGSARASGEILTEIKKHIPDYNYGTYGSAPPLIWMVAYAPHNAKGFQRFAALMSFPFAFVVLLSYAWQSLPMDGYSLDLVFGALALLPASWQTLRFTVGRIKKI